MGMQAQHYIPKFYLKGFADKSGALWVYERHKPLRESKPKYEANRPDYYAVKDDPQHADVIERELARLESVAAPIIRKMTTGQFVPTPVNIADLLLFVAFMFARVPVWRENLDKVAAQTAKKLHKGFASDKEAFHKICMKIATEKGMAEFDWESMRQDILSDSYELVQTSESFNLSAMFTSANSLARLLSHFQYQLWLAPEGRTFYTSDAPVFTLGPDASGVQSLGMGFDWPEVAAFFPVNKRACLYLKRGIWCGAMPASPERVDRVNRLVMMTASTFLYSSERFRRTSRLFNEYGCVMRAGENAYMTTEPPADWLQRRGYRR
jgi:Protein of unknown function (DUF4238)